MILIQNKTEYKQPKGYFVVFPQDNTNGGIKKGQFSNRPFCTFISLL